MSEIMNGDEINEIERYIPSGNPDALHRPLRNVVASHRALQAKVRELEERLNEQKQLTEHAEASEEYARAEWTKDLARLADLEAKLRKAEERLEIDHEYVPNNYTGELERVEVPAQERSKYPDGITCRDATIKLQDERIEQLKREKADLEAKLRQVEQERDQLRARVRELPDHVKGMSEND